jgi:HlyD family secretion protein
MTLTRKVVFAITLVFIAAVVVFAVRRDKSSTVGFFTAPIERGSLRNTVNATGVVQTVVTVQVGSQVSGLIQDLYADYNSLVKRGQLLARLDPRNFQAQLQNAEATVAAAQAHVQSAEADTRTQIANLDSARANLQAAKVARDNTAILFERNAGLSKEGVVSQNDYDNAKANADSARAKLDQAEAAVAQAEAQSRSSVAGLQQAKAQLQQAEADLNRAKLNLEYCNIYSPVDGVVISRNIDVGQTIAASLQSPTLFTIANDLSQMQVNANVDEADIGNISDEADVQFTVDAFPNEFFRGNISEIRLNPQTVQNVVTYSVIISIKNPDLKLKPGMTANITITVDQRENVLKVPNAALRYTPSGTHREQTGLTPATWSSASSAGDHGDSLVSNQVQKADRSPSQLAPGQKWNPSEKIKMVPPRRIMQRPGLVFVLDSKKEPEARRVVLGITDGSLTEVVSGELTESDPVIIGDNTQGGSTAPAPGFTPFAGFGPRGGGTPAGARGR